MSLDSVTEYALSFSEDAVHLQRREKPGNGREALAPDAWRHLGSVDFDSSAFRDDFIRLRGMATGPDQDVLAVTLIIPDDQILYTTLTVAPGADRDQAVGKALDGLTPYAIEDLAFDWQGEGDSVRVAAVARQTLHEARDFAAQYGFDGQGYCAAPEGDLYSGEPVFVTDPVQRPRPAVDPAQAGVTLAALQIEDEAGADEPGLTGFAEEQAALDLDLGGDIAEAVVVAETKADTSAKADAGAEVAPESESVASAEDDAASAMAADDQLIGEGTEEAVAEAAAETVSEPISAPVAESVEATVVEEAVIGADTAAAAAVEFAGEAAVVEAAATDGPATEAIAAEATAAQVTDSAAALSEGAETLAVQPHDPSADQPSANQGETPAKSLNPRAKAVHERAADARQRRQVGAAPSPARRPGERGGLVGLVAMLGALIVGLIVIWAFAVPGKDTPQLAAAAPIDQAVAAQPAPADGTTPAPVAEETAEAAIETSPALVGAAPAPVEMAEAQPAMPEVAATPASVPASAVPAETVPAAPAQVAQVEPAPQASALTEEEQRRVIVAASAVAAAVVPPSAKAPALAAVAQGRAPAHAASQPAQIVTASRPAPAPAQPRASQPAQTPPTQAAKPAATPAPAAVASRLNSSARPQLAPRRSTPQTTTPRTDTAPKVPSNPLPFEAAPRHVQPAKSARPPERARRAAVAAPATPTQPAAAASATSTSAAKLRGSSRPPARPEGSAPELAGPDDHGDTLTPDEQNQLRDLIRDLGRAGLTQTQSRALPQGARFAQVRPLRKPGGQAQGAASDAGSSGAVAAALRAATMPPPDRPERDGTAVAPARNSGGLLFGSSRPSARPGRSGGAKAPVGGLSDKAVEAAISAAVDASPATPGGVALAALASSPLPPRRGDAPATAAAAPVSAPVAQPATQPVAPAAVTPPVIAPAVVAAAPGPGEAELAARRKLDEQLQAQAEARIRARAAADAKAEAQARAQAEARARAQAAAEERAALAQRQAYKPPEVDNEPEIAATALSKGSTSATVASAATQTRGIDMGRTTIIGIIGAGNASRALIRLRNGKVVTVRMGDRIDGGTINSIGDGRLTYIKAGRTHELRMLDGR